MLEGGCVMRPLLFSVAVSVGVVFGSFGPATATPLATSGLSSQSTKATLVEDIGWRRQYRRYGYPVPYAYYPPAYGYYAPPPAAYYPPAYDALCAPASRREWRVCSRGRLRRLSASEWRVWRLSAAGWLLTNHGTACALEPEARHDAARRGAPYPSAPSLSPKPILSSEIAPGSMKTLQSPKAGAPSSPMQAA